MKRETIGIIFLVLLVCSIINACIWKWPVPWASQVFILAVVFVAMGLVFSGIHEEDLNKEDKDIWGY